MTISIRHSRGALLLLVLFARFSTAASPSLGRIDRSLTLHPRSITTTLLYTSCVPAGPDCSGTNLDAAFTCINKQTEWEICQLLHAATSTSSSASSSVGSSSSSPSSSSPVTDPSSSPPSASPSSSPPLTDPSSSPPSASPSSSPPLTDPSSSPPSVSPSSIPPLTGPSSSPPSLSASSISYPSTSVANNTTSWSASSIKSSPSSGWNATLASPTVSANASSNCTWSLPTTGSGFAYASSCAYIQNLLYFQTTTDSTYPCITDVGLFQPFIGTVIQTITTTIVSSYFQTTKLCDGIPRAVGSPTSVFSVAATITRAHWTFRSDKLSAMSSYFAANPSKISLLDPCSIQPQDCASLWRDWELQYISVFVKGADSGNIPEFPYCDYATTDCSKCTIFGGDVQLLYFATMTSQDICASAPATAKARRQVPTPNATTPALSNVPYAVLDGHTYYGDHVYISFDTVFASDPCAGTTVGTAMTGGILTLNSADLSSLRYPFYMEDKHSFNYADLNSPVPWSAYGAQSDCFFGFCQTISTPYNPQLMIPSAITAMDPTWANCELYWGGLHDPPLALQTASDLSDPTTTAAPADGPRQGQAPQTQPPGGSPQPASGSSSGSNDPGSPHSDPPQQDPSPVTVVDNQPIQPVDPSGAVVGGTTLRPGLPAVTIGNTPVSVGSAGLVVGTGGAATTIPLPAAPEAPLITPAPSVAVFPLGAQTYTADGSKGLVIGGTTLTQGGPAITISGSVVSVGAAGIVVTPLNGQQAGQPITYAFSASTYITVGGQSFDVLSSGGVIHIGTAILTPGGAPVTVNGHTFSFGSSGVVVDGTSTVPFAAIATAHVTLKDGGSVDMSSYGGLIHIGTAALTPGGPPVTINGHIYSADTSGDVIIDGTSTISLSPASATALSSASRTDVKGLATYIMSGLGGGSPSTTAAESISATKAEAVVSTSKKGDGCRIGPGGLEIVSIVMSLFRFIL